MLWISWFTAFVWLPLSFRNQALLVIWSRFRCVNSKRGNAQDRYFQILNILHVNNNQPISANCTNWVHWFCKTVYNFAKFRNPSQIQSLDEILFKGRIKQYSPKKPIRKGYKLWRRCDMLGYVYEWCLSNEKKRLTKASKQNKSNCGWVVRSWNVITIKNPIIIRIFLHLY